MAYVSFFPFCVLTALFAYPTLLLIVFCPMFEVLKIFSFVATNGALKLNWFIEILYLCTSSFPIVTTFVCCLSSKVGATATFRQERMKRYLKRTLIYLCPILWIIVPGLYTYLTFYEMGDVPFTCPQNYTYTTSEVRLACNIRLTNLLCMLIFPILCALYASSVWILITCSERTGQRCESRSVQFLKLYKNALFSDNGYSRIIDDDDDGIDFEENRVLFDEEEEFIKAELDTFNSNSNSDSA